ncbi:MAG: ribosome biogenesis GTPase Der [Victivallales bacterium]|nr:ribosome biogenesis GTPase Der [Victivallales bacterium]
MDSQSHENLNENQNDKLGFAVRERRITVPTVAVVGRPNVGKSSLFNVIVGRRLAIVHESSGVTRDRIVAPVLRHDKYFQLVDTGGLGMVARQEKGVDMWDRNIASQVETAIAGADLLIMVVNVQNGVVALDREVATRLRESGKKVIVAVNKVDEPRHEAAIVEFSELGFPEILPISCLHRQGIEALLRRVLAEIPAGGEMPEQTEPFRIAAIGRPNVGKSSLVNKLLGEERVMVSDVAGTTRDAIDIDFALEFKGEKLPACLIDTAGLRKKAKVDTAVEYFSTMRANDAISRSKVVLFLVEAAPNGVTAQDRRIASLIEASGKACIIVANKWDICEERQQKLVLDEIRYTLPGMNYAPVVFVCAKTGAGFDKLMDTIAEIIEQAQVQIPTSLINKVVTDAVNHYSAPVVGISPLKIYYTTMLSNTPPTFLMFVNYTNLCATNYLTYLTNYFRSAFGFVGQPLVIRLRERPKTIVSKRTLIRSSIRADGSGKTIPQIREKGVKGMKARRKMERMSRYDKKRRQK